MSTTLTTERQKPTLITLGKRTVVSTGRWNDDAMADYVMQEGREKWLKIGDLSHAAYHNGSPRSKARVRQCVHKLFNSILARGHILVIEYERSNGSGRATAVKIYDPTSKLDRDTLGAKIEWMRKRGAITANKLSAVIAIVSAHLPP